MAWIRLSDNYVDHPKFEALSDGSFRLWHEAMAYCRRHQSDGFFSFSSMRGFRYYTKAREKQLAAPYIADANPLWNLVPGGGYKIHDYLEWNPSRDEELERRAESRDKMRILRERRYSRGVPPVTANSSPPVTANSALITSVNVQERDTDTDLDSEKGDALLMRAGRLLQELYPGWYAKWRNGARLRLIANPLAFQDAVSVCRLWDDARIEKLARIVLTTDDQFISGTDRSFRIFAMKASWADDRLRQAESGAA